MPTVTDKVIDTIEELTPCLVCGNEMTEDEVYFKDGMIKMPQDTEEPTEIKHYCKQCVVTDQKLIDRSNYMIRYMVSLLLRETDKEERLEMMKALQEDNPDNFKIVGDMFDVDDYVKIIKTDVVAEGCENSAKGEE